MGSDTLNIHPLLRLGIVVALTITIVLLIGCAANNETVSVLGPSEQGGFELPPPFRSDYSQTNNSNLPVLDEEADLSDYLQYAARNNPDIQSAYYGWVAAIKKAEQAGYLPEPQLEYGIFARQSAGRQNLRLSQMFPWFGILSLREQMAESESLAELSAYESRINRIFGDFVKAYADYYYLGRRIEITRENLTLIETIESSVRTRYAAGAVSYSDVVRAQVALGRMENELQSVLDMRQVSAGRLNSLLGRPLNAPLDPPDELAESVELPEYDMLREYLREANPEIIELERRREAGETALSLAGKAYYPDIMLGVEYMDMRGSDMMMDEDLMLMVGVTLPIWRGKYRAGEEEAHSRIRSIDKRIEDRTLSLESGLESALFGFRDARRRIELYGDFLLPKAEEALEVTTTAYQAGDVSFQDLLDAWRVLLEFRLALENANTEELKAIAEIEVTTGLVLLEATGDGRSALEESHPEN